MSITLVAIALIAIGNIFYAYRCILGTRAFIDQYGMGCLLYTSPSPRDLH